MMVTERAVDVGPAVPESGRYRMTAWGRFATAALAVDCEPSRQLPLKALGM